MTRDEAEANLEALIDAYLDDRNKVSEFLRVYRFGGLQDLVTMLHKLVHRRVKQSDPHSEWAIAAEAFEELETTLAKRDAPMLDRPYGSPNEKEQAVIDYMRGLRGSGAL